jgi:hypothetical protein
MNQRKQLLALIAGALLAVSLPAAAGQIGGDFQVTGSFIPTQDGSPLTNFMGANEIDFTDGAAPTPGTPGTITVQSTSGDFASLLTVGQTGTIQDFAFAGSARPEFPIPLITGFQQIGSVSVNLLNIAVVQQNEAFLNLRGTTSVSAPDFDDTPGNFNFVGQSNGDGTFSFRGTTGQIAAVPEPPLVLLLGAGLVAMALVSRKVQSKR